MDNTSEDVTGWFFEIFFIFHPENWKNDPIFFVFLRDGLAKIHHQPGEVACRVALS